MRNVIQWFRHGRYIGSNWSNNRRQASVHKPHFTPIDRFDRTGMVHDRAYARGGDRRKADFEFFRANFGRGIKPTVAAIGVGAQGLTRKRRASIADTTPPMDTRSPPKRERKYSNVNTENTSVVVGPPRKRFMIPLHKKYYSRKIKLTMPKLQNVKYYTGKAFLHKLEWSKNYVGSDSVYTGMQTMVRNFIMTNCMFTFFKTMYNMDQKQIKSTDDKFDQAKFGTNIAFVGYQTQDVTSETKWFDVPIVDANTSWWYMAEEMAKAYNNYCNANPRCTLQCLIGYSGTFGEADSEYFRVDAANIKFHIGTLNRMTIQNRTLATAAEGEPNNDSFLSVSANPLFMHEYRGVGAYLSYRGSRQGFNPRAFTTRPYFELDTVVPTDANTSQWTEPPMPRELLGVQSYRKTSLAPGTVRTITVADKKLYSINKLGHAFDSAPWGTDATNHNPGKFVFIGFEHKLDNAGTNTSINIATEIDYKTFTSCDIKVPQFTIARVRINQVPPS